MHILEEFKQYGLRLISLAIICRMLYVCVCLFVCLLMKGSVLIQITPIHTKDRRVLGTCNALYSTKNGAELAEKSIL